jgi:hypothetical protein
MKANLAALAAKSKAYSRRLFQSGLGKYEVCLAYFSCFVPAMIFTMAVTSFTAGQLMSLKKQAIRATLACLGFNRNISREIVFGSPLFGGIGLRDLVLEQGIAQLELLLRHVCAGTPHGSLFLIGLSWWHLVAGFTASLWETTDAHIPYIERSWYTSLKDFLLPINSSVFIPLSEFIHWRALRHHDAALMERISKLEGVSRADLASCNCCQLYLGVNFLSKIFSDDG